MSINLNPKVIQDGLILNIDAANLKSFRGEPTSNIITNPTCISIPQLGTTPSFTYATGSLTNEKFISDNKALKMSINFVVGSCILYFSSSGRSDMVAGNTYTFSFYVYVPTGMSCNSIRIVWYDYAPIGNQSPTTTHTSISRDEWVRLSATRTLRPETTQSFIYLYWYFDALTTSFDDYIYFDAFQLEEGSTPTTFTTESTNLMLYPDCESAEPRLKDSAMSDEFCLTTRTTERSYQGSYSLKVTKNGVTYIQYNLTSSDLSGMIAGSNHTFSFYVFIPDDFPINYFRARWYHYISTTGTYTNHYVYNTDFEKGKWCRVEFHKTIAGDITKSFIYIYIYLTNYTIDYHGKSIYIDNVQLESKSYKTHFTTGTRGSTVATGGGLVDLSRNSSDGELVNAPTYDSANGGSLLFNGTNQYVILNYGASLNPTTTPITILLFVKLTATTSGQIFMSSGQSGNNDARIYLATSYSGKWDTGIYNQTYGSTTASISSTTDWTHICLVMDGTTAKLYVNLELGNEKSYSSYTTCGNFYLGTNGNSLANYFGGKISNVQIYNRALTQAEISRNFNALRGRFGI